MQNWVPEQLDSSMLKSMQSAMPSQRWKIAMHWLVEAHNKEPLKQSLMAEMKSNMTVIISYIYFPTRKFDSYYSI